jgi:hypothetical protein
MNQFNAFIKFQFVQSTGTVLYVPFPSVVEPDNFDADPDPDPYPTSKTKYR